MERYYFTGICNYERHECINKLERIITNYGFITDFKMLSDISLSIIIEINRNKINALYYALRNYLIMDPFNNPDSKSTDECILLMHVTFKHGTGDLAIEVPNVPG
ncbi:MAG: hypothetical protein V2I54_06585 [Bacteroidales bacterium]|jgi:hypothetical protein|nr:hypothetical protein [Bacteroidales bacterium]